MSWSFPIALRFQSNQKLTFCVNGYESQHIFIWSHPTPLLNSTEFYEPIHNIDDNYPLTKENRHSCNVTWSKMATLTKFTPFFQITFRLKILKQFTGLFPLNLVPELVQDMHKVIIKHACLLEMSWNTCHQPRSQSLPGSTKVRKKLGLSFF